MITNFINIHLDPVDDSQKNSWKAWCEELPGIIALSSDRNKAYEDLLEMLDELTSPYRTLH